MNKKVKRYLSVLAFIMLLLGVTMGYSVLSQSLNISSTSLINAATFNVHFANIQVSTGSVNAVANPTTTGLNKTEMTFDVNLDEPGDYYEFTFDVENSGSVDAKLSEVPSLTGISSAQDVFINYTITHNDAGKSDVEANEVIPAFGGTTSYVVRVEFDKNIVSSQYPTSPQTLDLGVELNYVQSW